MGNNKIGKTVKKKGAGPTAKKPGPVKRKSFKTSAPAACTDDHRVPERCRIAQRIARYGLWEHDLVTGKLWWSEELYRIFGLDSGKSGITIEQFFSCIHPEDRGSLADAIRTNKPYRQNYRIILPNGEIKHIHEEVHIHHDASGKPQLVLGTAQDVTEQSRARERLEASEEKYRRLFERSPIAIIHFDHESVITECNEKAMEILGARRERIIGFSLRGSLQDSRMRQAVEASLDGKNGHFDGNYTSVTGGRTTWLRGEFAPVFGAAGAVKGGIGIFEDVSDQKRLEGELQRGKQMLQTIFDAEPECVKMLAADGSLLMMNPAGLSMLQADSLEQVQGSCVDLLVNEPFRDSFRRLTERVFRGEEGMLEFEMTGLKGRRLWMETHAVPLRDESGEIFALLGVTRNATERKRTDEALRASEDQLAQAQIMAHVGNWEWDVLTNKVFWSDEVYRIYGYEPREVDPDYGLVLQALHPETKGLFLASIDAALKGERPFDMDYVFTTKAGIKKTLHTIGRVLRDETGKALRMIGTVQDITDRKRAEADLRESEARFRGLFDNAPDAEFLADVESGLIVDVNPAACRLLGRPRERILGLHQSELHPPEERDNMKALFGAHIDQSSAGKSVIPHDALVLRADGARVPVEITAQQILLRGRQVLYGIFRDISRRKQAEIMVSNILETVDEAFIIIDRDFNVLSANRAYGVQAGRPVSEIIGRKCHEISHGISRPCYEVGEDCAVRRVMETGEPSSALHTHYDEKKNPIYVETKAFPMKDASGRVTAAIEIVNNITEKKKLEEQLRQAQKMEAVGLLAGGVAHDFNNILTAIIGYGNLLDMKLPSDDPLRSYVEQVLASAARAANLTQSLLAFSRKQIINPRPLDMNDVIMRIAKLLRRVIGEDVELKLDLSPGGLTVVADPSQMEQVLMNLATNSRDAMPGGGTLSVVTGAAVVDQEFRQQHGFGRDGVYARISVTDTGTGMDEQTQERIFEPFFTTKELGRGTGLGLAIVYGIVKQNNGYVAVSSESGRGTTFTLYFPIVKTAAEELTSAPADREPLRGSGVVLLAEDDPTLRTLMRTILTQFGYEVIESSDGVEAVELFSERPERVDLLLLDVIMPKKNGKAAYEDMKRLRPGIKTLFMSGYSDQMIDRTLLYDEGCRFIAKPVAPAELLKIVREMMTAK